MATLARDQGDDEDQRHNARNEGFFQKENDCIPCDDGYDAGNDESDQNQKTECVECSREKTFDHNHQQWRRTGEKQSVDTFHVFLSEKIDQQWQDDVNEDGDEEAWNVTFEHVPCGMVARRCLGRRSANKRVCAARVHRRLFV